MKWKTLGLVGLVLACGTGPATAQPSQQSSDPAAAHNPFAGNPVVQALGEPARADATRLDPAKAAPDLRPLYEEIEIMRRLLERRLAGLPGGLPAGGVHRLAFSPDGRALVADSAKTASDSYWLSGMSNVRVWDAATGKLVHPSGAPELSGPQGVYLKGYGVVYCATLPLHFQQPVTDLSRPVHRPPTEWERVRRELHGEKVEPEESGGRPEESVADAVLKLLAENGHHITRLPAGEQLTVALTLSRGVACEQCHGPARAGSGGGAVGMYSGMSGATGAGPSSSPTAGTPGMPGGPAGPAPAALAGGNRAGMALGGGDALQRFGPELAARKADGRKEGLLGDLQFKQGQYREAAEAYEKALEAYRKAVEFQRRAALDLTGVPPPPDAAADLEALELTTRLARTYLAQGKKDQAQQAIQSVAAQARRAAQAESLGKPAEGRDRPPLPERLVISVPKKLLDEAGAGTVPFEEFRKAATVQYLKFEEAGPAPTKR